MGRHANLGPPLDPDLAGEVSQELASAFTLALELVRVLDHGPNDARTLEMARDIERGLQRRLDIHWIVNSALNHTHDIARDIVVDLDRAGAHDLDLVLVRARARALASALRRARTLIRVTAWDLGFGTHYGIFFSLARTSGRLKIARAAKRIAPSAASLLAVATRLLPAADRARYAEEYLSELWEIAYARCSRPSQLAYAFRQLVSALRLHAELRAPRRRKASL